MRYCSRRGRARGRQNASLSLLASACRPANAGIHCRRLALLKEQRNKHLLPLSPSRRMGPCVRRDDVDGVSVVHNFSRSGERSSRFLVPPPFVSFCGEGGAKRRVGILPCTPKQLPTRHIVRSARDVPALRASFARLDPTKGHKRGGMNHPAIFTDTHSPPNAKHTHTSAISPRIPARALHCVEPSEIQRAQGMPGARCACSLACKKYKAYELVTTVTPESPGIPYAMVLRLISRSPR
jgi:hypothetical protein